MVLLLVPEAVQVAEVPLEVAQVPQLLEAA